MFNSTHTFVGLAIARTGVDKWVRYASLTAVIASNLPDIDIVTAAAGTPTYIDYHRGFTHTIVGVPVLSLLLAACMYYFSGKFWRTFAVALLAMTTHPILDYANTYGLRPFLPFNSTWHYGDFLFIIDPYIDVVLLLGILSGTLIKQQRKAAAYASLLLVVAYIGARAELHSMAAARLEQFVDQIPAAGKWAVLPTMLNPFRWIGIVETKNEMLTVTVDALKGIDGEADRMSRGPSPEILSRMPMVKSADVLMRFARFPIVRVEGLRLGSEGYRVLLFDFRFYNDSTHTALGSEVILDRSLHVVKESLSFAQIIN